MSGRAARPITSGGGNELQALFNFPINRYLFLGLAQQSADPIKFGLAAVADHPAHAGQWVNFCATTTS